MVFFAVFRCKRIGLMGGLGPVHSLQVGIVQSSVYLLLAHRIFLSCPFLTKRQLIFTIHSSYSFE